MKEFREHDEIEQDDKDRLYTLDEIMSNSEVEERKLSTHERADLLQDIHCKLLSEDERDELIKEINGNSKSRDIEIEMSSPSKSNTGEIQESKEWAVNMWEPRIRDIPAESEEQVMTVFQNLIPGILKHRMFDNLKHQISMHMRTTQEFGHRNRVTYREINEFAKQNDYPSSTIESWVLHGVQPNSYRIINENALTREEAEALVSKIKEKLHGLDTQIELDTRLDTPFHESRTKSLPSFRRDYENACGFYRFLDEFVDGGVLNDIAERVGIDRLVARRYIEDKMIPRLIRKVLNQSLDEIEDINRRVIIQDEVQYEQILSRHPHIRDMDNFTEMDRHMRAYLKLKHLQQSDTLPEISQEELAANLGISGPRLNVYLSDKSAPKLQSILLLHENARLGYERRLSPVAFEHRIEPELVFRELHRYKGMERIDIDDFATSLRTIYEKTAMSSKIEWLDLRRYAPTGQDWFKRIVKFCAKGRTEIEHALNQQLGFDTGAKQRLRLGVISSRIYLRLEDTQETDWMQLYGSEMFHFHAQELVDGLLRDAKSRLAIGGDISLSRLIHQVTDYDKSLTKSGMNSDLHPDASYLKGFTLSLVLDSCDMTIQDIEDGIDAIGRIDRRLIRNPRFSKDAKEVDMAFARLFGAGLSDGHIDQFHVFCYGESDIDRVNIFKEHMKFFGDVDYTETIDEKGFHDLRYSCVLGRILERRGFPVGDKTVQNRGIPDFILNGPVEVQIEYLKQLWAEDGYFISGTLHHQCYFGWTRSVSLLDPEKDTKYFINSNFTQNMLRFITDHGTYKEDSSFSGKDSYPRYIMTRADLTKCLKHTDLSVSDMAEKISSFIETNKPKLMIDEQNLVHALGADTWSGWTEVSFFLETGRVSVLWRARTKTLNDTMRIAIMASPDDIRKSTLVNEWVQTEKARHRRIMYELKAQRISNPTYH